MLGKLPQSLGHALQAYRAGLDKLLFNRIDLREGTARLEVTSLAFADHAPLPIQYTADGEGTSPPLAWRGVPPGTHSLALIVEDADSPTREPLVHAIAVDIDPERDGLAEGELVEESDDGAVNLGRNSFLRQAWLPPDPPPGHGRHRYAFQLFALTPGEPFSDAPGRDELAKAVRERAIASGCLIGTYERDNTVKIRKTEPAAIDTAAAAQ
ncbi:MAG TPA: YbhB/YbcL family Raf kinase inhibitor-like protein [Steroidobacteraceae bacterium]|nr:YbhB/YbcL family Raf kinase inhibitor-like protein [Steroidobacteraceae bacterium]